MGKMNGDFFAAFEQLNKKHGKQVLGYFCCPMLTAKLRSATDSFFGK